MADLSRTNQDTQYNQKVFAAGVRRDTGNETRSRQLTSRTTRRSERDERTERSQTGSDITEQKTVNGGGSTDTREGETKTERTSETERSLNSKATGSARSIERANVAMQISFTVPIRQRMAGSGSSSAC